MDPCWSNDGKKIAFSHPNINKIHWTEWINTLTGETGKTKEGYLWDVYLVNSDGTNRKNITENLYEASCPSWSFDNEKILFGSAPEFNNEYLDYNHIFIYDLKKNKIVKIAEADMRKGINTSGFTWSTNGKKVAFVSNFEGISSLYITSFSNVNYQTVKIKENVGHFYWSPDNNKICFYKANTFADDSTFTILDLKNLFEFDVKVLYFNISWSPDGKYLIYYKLNVDETLTLCLMNVESYEETNLFNCGNLVRDNMIAKFSPNMEKICFNVKKDNKNFIYIMNFFDKGTKEYKDFNGNVFWAPDSQKILIYNNSLIIDLENDLILPITKGITFDSSEYFSISSFPKWSNDSKKLCFRFYSSNLINGQICIFNVDNQKASQLTNDKNLDCLDPEWSPNGYKILFQRGHLSHNNQYDYFDYYVINDDGTDLINISNLSIFE
jgi:Tol biopolymer transport system component